jgi:acetate kinase
VAQRYALPGSLFGEGIRRYGFHGLSYEYILQELGQEAGAREAAGRLIIAHLGNGASLCAVRDGRSVASTMGFTAVDGLMMGTRSGALDPGVLLYLLNEKKFSGERARQLVHLEAGLLGVSGRSADMEELLKRESSDPHAAEAIDLFCYQARKYLAALAATLGGLDTLIFTAGIGENSSAIRSRICHGLEFLGISLDENQNDKNAAIISQPKSPVTVRVMKTNEELMIARHTRALL